MYGCQNSRIQLSRPPHLAYACQVWYPYTDKDICKLESVQRRAARYISNRYHNTSSPTEMLSLLEWNILQQRRAKIRLITLYNIIHNLIELPEEQYLLPPTSSYQHKALNFQRPFTPTNYLKYSFFPRTIAQWNSLSLDIKSSTNLEGFKTRLSGAFVLDLIKH